jgi:hypothetical protein
MPIEVQLRGQRLKLCDMSPKGAGQSETLPSNRHTMFALYVDAIIQNSLMEWESEFCRCIIESN